MKKSNIIMFFAALFPLALFIFPLWNITLEAPQYPTPLGMNIYINDFSDANPHDIKNINLMNHYVGMKYIPKSIPCHIDLVINVDIAYSMPPSPP